MIQDLTLEDLKGLGKLIDTYWIVERDLEGYYSVLNNLTPCGWALLRNPLMIAGGIVVALLVRPRDDEEDE